MKSIPESHLDLFSGKKAFASLATVMSDGSPQVTPVWFFYKNVGFFLNTARGRVQDRNMSDRARVALVILDSDDPYKYVALRGTVVRVTEEGADANIDALAKKYLGVDSYPR